MPSEKSFKQVPLRETNEIRAMSHMRISTYSRFYLVLLLLLCSGASAAEFHFLPRQGVGPSTMRMDGPISDGDAEKLKKWILENPAEYLVTNNIELSSSGGSVLEAMKLARLVELSGWTALVSSGETCASACFFIFSSAQVRISAGDVVVHRPYFDKVAQHPTEHFAQIKAQGEVAIAARDYLSAKGVSSRIVDLMMSLPSNRGYALTSRDFSELGYLAPVAEEQAIRRCSIDNANFLAKYGRGKECLESIFIPLRNSMIEETLGVEALHAARPRARALYLNQEIE